MLPAPHRRATFSLSAEPSILDPESPLNEPISLVKNRRDAGLDINP
jgi:hypothetical protein